MGFICRQGRFRMEVVVGLLIVIGTMLEGSEGFLRCHESTGKAPGRSRDCGTLSAAFLKIVYDNGNVKRSCVLSYNKNCGGCRKISSREDAKQLDDCTTRVGRTVTENETGNSLMTVYDDDISKKGRQSRIDTGRACVCYTNLCNPAGRPTSNAQVFLGVLVAASIYAFNFGQF